MFDPKILSNHIRHYRLRAGLSQQALAEKLFVSGQAISKWESGQSVPDLANLVALAEVFSVSTDTLMGYLPQRKQVFLGIDGGATKTEFVLIEQDGSVISRLALGGCNPNVTGLEGAWSILRSGIDAMLMKSSGITGIFAGIAGIMSGDHLEKTRAFLTEAYPHLPFSLGSDILNVITAAGDFQNCAAAICGTGFVVYANTDGVLHRVGGWGYLLDNASGGYSLGREALRAVLAEADGFGQPTLLTAMVTKALGTDVWPAIPNIYAGGDSFIASLAPLVFEAYSQGDNTAADILDEYTTEMAILFDYVLSAYDCDRTLILSGGLFQSSVLVELLGKKIKSDTRIILADNPPVYGACRKACCLYGTPGEDFADHFKKSYHEQRRCSSC